MKLFLDFETKCDLDLKQVGLDLYSSHPSCEVLMCSWGIENEPVDLWCPAEGEEMPAQLLELLEDDEVQLHAFNAQFERVIMNRVLGIKPKMKRWRCTMVLAYMHSFTGDLGDVGRQIGIPEDKQKLAEGKRLIHIFCKPQRITKNQPHKWRNADTDYDDWELFKQYCVMDNIAEQAIDRELDQPQYPIPPVEWKFYALDQIINDRGLPIDRGFCENALKMATRRKHRLQRKMNLMTGLQNSNSGPQLLPWLKERGYPFDDLQKDTVKKVLTADEAMKRGDKIRPGELMPKLTKTCREILLLRQKAARTSTSKYSALLKAMGLDGRMRYVFQFCGAARTGRFAGRRFQPQNLTTLKTVEDEHVLEIITEAIRQNDFEYLELLVAEPLDALAGLVRSAVRAPKNKRLKVCDLASIESVVIGWVSKCERLLNVFRNGKDAYKDFATELYQIPYDDVTKHQRKMAKPATLGAGYRLGGGELKDGKKTGLWGYAENMGVDMTRQESHKNVATFRRVYPEIPNTWYALEDAIMDTIKNERRTRVGPVKFRWVKPYLVCELPSGRCIYYHKPRVERKPFEYVDKKTGKRVRQMKDQISYMGKQQNGKAWIRIYSHGGKFIENIVQAIARDILRECLLRLHTAGFTLVGHVHDEAISLEAANDNELTHDHMQEIMCQPISWAAGMPLGAAGFSTVIYRKD